MRGDTEQSFCIRQTQLTVDAVAATASRPRRSRAILAAVLVWTAAAVAALGLVCGAAAQSPSVFDESGDDNPRGNVNLAVPVAIPVGDTANAVHLGMGLTVGGGYNFTRNHGLVSEFMWNDLFATNEALAKVRLALKDPNINANADLLAFTGNYRYELRGRAVGGYLIGGGGLYYRHVKLTKQVTTGSDIVCTPMWLWWGFTCESGTVTENQTITSWSASAPGWNAGAGFTARVGEAPYRVYIETRYHYAPDKRVNTQLVNISFGIRY